MIDIKIPEGVTEIGECAFSHCMGLTDINIPSSMTQISKLTFWECSSLIKITVPEGVTKIGTEAFYWCKSLKEVFLPNSLKYVGDNIFKGCTSLININDLSHRFFKVDQFIFEKISSTEYNALLKLNFMLSSVLIPKLLFLIKLITSL